MLEGKREAKSAKLPKMRTAVTAMTIAMIGSVSLSRKIGRVCSEQRAVSYLSCV